MFQNFSVPQLIFHAATFPTMHLSQKVICTIFVPFILSVGFVIFVIKKPLLWLRHYISAEHINLWSRHKFWLSFITSTAAALFGMLTAVAISDVSAAKMIEDAKYTYSLMYDPPPYDTIIDENFANPQDLHIRLQNPQNLIIIFAESFERTFTDKNIFKENLLPNLSQRDGTSFIGYKKLTEVDWTHSSIISSLCGITYKQYLPPRDLSKKVICANDIMQQFGYFTYFLKGSTLKFVDFRDFLKDHNFSAYAGIDELPHFDKSLLEDEKLYSDKLFDADFIGDILDDAELLRIFKEKILQISRGNKPFMAIAVTINTHPYHGFISSTCAKTHRDMRGAILCSDSQLSEFVEWFKQQDFARNTTLIIMGDHLMMYSDIQKYLDMAQNRETLNLMWGKAAPEQNIRKEFSQFDWAPTLLEMAGFVWNSRKFGLGTSLFSDQKTLQEIYGENLDKRLLNSSKLYEERVFE